MMCGIGSSSSEGPTVDVSDDFAASMTGVNACG